MQLCASLKRVRMFLLFLCVTSCCFTFLSQTLSCSFCLLVLILNQFTSYNKSWNKTKKIKYSNKWVSFFFIFRSESTQITIKLTKQTQKDVFSSNIFFNLATKTDFFSIQMTIMCKTSRSDHRPVLFYLSEHGPNCPITLSTCLLSSPWW